MTDYIDELNESQRAAVLYNEGPSLVIAGAGSGKTRVLTYKIAYLLESGLEPWSVLALTFTNKAAREMNARISKQVGEQRARYLWMGTFHSVFSRILRVESATLGFTSSFTIYDTSDSKSLIRTIVKEMQLDDKTYKASAIQSQISNAKNHLISPASYAMSREMIEHDNACKMPALKDIYRRYCERCRQAGAMDFDDLLFYTFILFRDNPAILKKYQEQFKYILVDEYQDTNFAQHSIVLQLAKEHQKVCVVGDDAQSIYSFRGANIDNILKFTQLYQNAQVFKLEQNYRSTQTIVCAANSLIAKNREQIQKEVFSEKDKGEPIIVSQAYSDVEEGDIVCNKISELRMSQNYSYDDYAILYRTNAQSRIFEEALRKRNIPYKIYGGLSFYQRKEIKDIIAYFRLVCNPNDEEAFKRIINYPTRGIGDTTVGKLLESSSAHNVSLWQIISAPLEYGVNINKGTHTKLQGFRELIEGFIEMLPDGNAYEVGTAIVKQSGIVHDIYQDRTPENLSRQENIEEMMNGVHDFCAMREEEGNENVSLSDFLSEVSLLSDQDSDKGDQEEKVTLMTVHSAKGLEFRNVFVVGMEENLFPSNMSGDSPRAMEEERRLFYVALTRAEDHCFLSYAKTRFRYGKMEFASPSRFLRDIDARYLQMPTEQVVSRSMDDPSGNFRQQRVARPASSLFAGQKEATKQTIINNPAPRHLTRVQNAQPKTGASDAPMSVQCGQQIEHERFGIGEVIKMEGTGENLKATVKFNNAGEKQLLLKFARFKVLS